MKKKPSISTARAVEVFNEMVSLRRYHFSDHSFFRMNDVWEDLCDEEGRWSIRPYATNESDDLKRKAAVIAFGDRVILTLDRRLMENAKKGCKFSNFILAHELAHVALDHNAKANSAKHFKLAAGPLGNSIVPPTDEELEADFAAVILQCGVQLFDKHLSARELARRASCDIFQVEKVQELVQSNVFKVEFDRLSKTAVKPCMPAGFESEYWKDQQDWGRLMTIFNLTRDEVAKLVEVIWRRRL